MTTPIRDSLYALGLTAAGDLHHNLSAAALFEHAVRRREGLTSEHGAFVVATGEHTGRAAKDKYIVRDATTGERVRWSETTKPLEADRMDALWRRACHHLTGRELFVSDLFVGADPHSRLPIRVVAQHAWHALFARNMFLRPASPLALDGFEPRFTVVASPDFRASPARDGTRSETFIALDMRQRVVLIGGTAYAGEIKKSIFTVMNYLLPHDGVLPMHCSANVGSRGDVALLFGLSGTGKTTLSADPERRLIGDDEHGWSERGVFNLEGGCYAKVIKLSAEAEPEIYATTRRFGTVLENVAIDPETRRIDLDDDRLTENTRASYPIDFIPRSIESGTGAQPAHVVLLTADAFGVLPPIAELTTAQAMFHFLSGYTAKVAGTEMGVREPTATFSACFGAPFMPLHPGVYARLLGERIAESGARCWLLNTGWSGGPYGVGTRIKIADTRALLRAALAGALDDVPRVVDPVFGLAVPRAVPGIADILLTPRRTWADGAAYDQQARKLADLFAANFRQYAGDVAPEVRDAAPSTP